jgi:hypothetical protein
MAKYSICFPDAFVCVPVQMAPQEFDPWEYTKDCFYLWNNGSVHWVEFYFKVPDYDSIQDQPAARLIRFVASEMSWTPESGLSMIPGMTIGSFEIFRLISKILLWPRISHVSCFFLPGACWGGRSVVSTEIQRYAMKSTTKSSAMPQFQLNNVKV